MIGELPRITISLKRGDTSDASCAALPDRFYALLTARQSADEPAGAYERNVSILTLPEPFDAYWSSPDAYWMRQKIRRAQKLGYRCELVDRRLYEDDVLAINTSLPARQGRPMAEAYLERPTYSVLPDYPCVRHQFATFGVVREGHLYAYAWIYQVGEMCLLSEILGHGEHLDDGIMNLLIFESIRELNATAGTRFAMYNLHDSGTEGLRFFKEKMSFRPHDVSWSLT